MQTIVSRLGRPALAIGAVVILCVTAGASIAYFPPLYVFAAFGSCAACLVGFYSHTALLGWCNRGVLVGMLVLLLLNGVPFVNIQLGATGSAGSNALNDVVYLILVGVLFVCAARRIRNPEQDRIARMAFGWSAVYLTWWTIKVVGGSGGVPIYAAAKYGRAFFYFGTLLPLLLYGLREKRHLLSFLYTLAAGVALFSIGQIATTEHHEITGLIHIDHINEFQGLTRVYTFMSELLIIAFPMALATLLLGPRRWRGWAILLTVLTGAANALAFTRAAYFSELLALSGVSAFWAWRTGWQARRVRWFAYGALLIVLVVIISGAGTEGTGGSSSSSPAQAVVTRLALGVTNAQNQTGTAGLRLRLVHLELEVLGAHWPVGLGFLDPSHYYVPGLPHGSIQDNDLGALAILMTMGIVGLIIAYMPPIAALIYLLKRGKGFIQYGGAMCLVTILIGSLTLGGLSTESGLLALVSLLTICLNLTALSITSRASTPPPRPNETYRGRR